MSETKIVYPGIRNITDGSGAAVWVETHVSQGACAYPITPSSNMGVEYAAAVADGATSDLLELIVRD